MISIYGRLARKFEKKYKKSGKNINIKVNSAGEMIRALDANYSGFRILLRRGYYRITRGDSFVNGKDINIQEVNMKFSETHWHIMPCALGLGGSTNPIVMAIAGALIVYVAMHLGPAGLYFAKVGMATGGISAGLASFGVMFGMGLLLGGLSMILSPDSYNDREVDERPSYLFDGPTNAIEPGLTIPTPYGETFIGSIFISGGLEVIDI